MDPADALAQQLDAHRRHVLDAAGGEEADAWAKVAASYGVSSAGQVTKDEVHAVGAAIAAACTDALKHIEGEARPDRVVFLRGRLDRFADEVAGAHETSKRGSNLGLGSIFANATAHAGWTAGGHHEVKRVIRCKTCGAAQEQARVFVCAYCQGPVFPTDEPAGA